MNQAILDPFIESRVEAFELGVSKHPQTKLEDFLPESDHVKYRELLTELIRVDLELAWGRNERPSLQRYRDRFRGFFEDQEALEQLTFEEFRQRRQAGDDVLPEEYESSYHVDTKKWRDWTQEEDTGILPAELHGDDGGDYGRGAVRELADEAEPEVGSRWQGFDLIRQLARGSFGQALLARQSALSNRDVVLKFSWLQSNEAQRLAELQHTNIVPVFSVHADAGRTVMCLPFLGETTLANLTSAVAQETDLPTRGDFIVRILPATSACDGQAGESAGEALDYYRDHSYVESVLWLVARLADALHHSHKRKILHCDIKPANVMLRSDGEPMLIDFNLAMRADGEAALAAAGGTLPYMAPEQLAALDGQTATLDARSDVYGLGVLLYQLLTGRLPWNASSSKKDIAAWSHQRRRPYPSLTRLNGQTTPAIASIVQTCLAFNRGDRYQTAGQLRDDLRRHLDNQPLQVAANRSWRESLRKWTRRNPWLFSLTTAAVISLTAFALLAAAWQIRETRLANARATLALGQLSEQAAALRPSLLLAAVDRRQAESLVREAEGLAHQYQIDQDDDINEAWPYLDDASRDAWRRESSGLCALIAQIQSVRSQQTPDLDERQVLLESARAWNTHAARWGGLDAEFVQRQRARIEASQSNAPSGDRLAGPGESGISALLSGHELLMASKPSEAALQFQRATERAPTDATNWLMLAEAQMELGEYSQAEACLDVAALLRPDSPLPLFRRGRCRMAHGQYRAAIDDFSSVLQLRPDLLEARLNRGLAYQALDDHKKALEDIDAAIAAGCRQTRAHFIRSGLRLALGDLAGAAEARREGLALQPTDEDSWIARGHARLSLDPQGALADFEAALAENPLSTNALQNIAHVLSERLKLPEKAIEALSRVLSINPSVTIARAGRGVLQARLGNLDAATADAKALVDAQQLAPVVQYQVGCIYALCFPERPESESSALAALAESFAGDRQLLELAKTDPDLDPIRDTAAFRNLIETASEFNELRDVDQVNGDH